MPAGYPEWPGPRSAEVGQGYTRQHPTRDANVFIVEAITETEEGSLIVSGSWEEM